MKGQRHCGSIKDIKMVCPKCASRYFFPIGSYNGHMLDALKENGPIRIACPWCWDSSSGGTVVDLNNPKDGWYGPDPDGPVPKKDVNDVMYFGENYQLGVEFEKQLEGAFPTVILGDASDGIHGKRTSVYLKGNFRNEYLTWIIKNGFGMASFILALILKGSGLGFGSKEDTEVIKKAISELKETAV
jgi:hypothetical protein